MKKVFALVISVLLSSTLVLNAQSYKSSSPDGNMALTVKAGKSLSWTLAYKNKVILRDCEISMQVNEKQVMGKRPRVTKKEEKQIDEVIYPVVPAKNSKIKDQCNQLTLFFNGDFAVEFRVYDEGVAYRFITSKKEDITVQAEGLDINFAGMTTSLFPEEESLMSHYERVYKEVKLEALAENQFGSLPVLMNTGNVNVLVTEADLFDYPNMFLYGRKANALKAGFPKHVLEAKASTIDPDRNQIITKEADYIAKTSGDRSFPWRVFIITDDDRKLVESDLVFQLSRPLALKNTDWIRPGKVAWDWYNANNIYGVDFESGLNTETYKYFIDFASKYGLEYIILDEGWSKSTTNIVEPNPDIDVLELVEYGKQKDVGVILWVLWGPLNQDVKGILKSYKDWGVKGIKVDFMQRADQYIVNYYERVTRECAKQELLVDFHGAYKPTGMHRAYPNLISYEGLKGNENNKWSTDINPEHNVTLPFTRMVAGPMDFTPGAMVNAHKANHKISFERPEALGTRCHQIAMYMVFESPLQMLCDTPSAYYDEKETTEFISRIPSIWDETIVLDAKVADYILIARRRGATWYIGAMTDWDARELEVDFSFLSKGWHSIDIMQDGPNASRHAQDYTMKKATVTRDSKMKINLVSGGGWAAIVTKE